METLGRLLGIVTICGFLGSFARLLLVAMPWLQGRSQVSERASEKWAGLRESYTKFFVKPHRIWAGAAILGLIGHAIIQWKQYGPVWSGVIPGALLVLQVASGVILRHKKRPWVYRFHWGLGIILAVFVLVHRFHLELFFDR